MSLPVIAIVNDDPSFLELVQDLIEDSRKYDVKVFQQGMGAVQHLRAIKPDVVVMDIRMEYARLGYHVIEGIRRDEGLKHLPIIVCTADAGFLEQYADRLEELGTDTLEKPFQIEDLLKKIDSAIQNSRQAM